MANTTFGDVQKLAKSAGLVMSRLSGGVRVRYRDPSATPAEWTGLSVPEALEVVLAQGGHREPG